MRRLTREDLATQLFEFTKRLDESRLRPLAQRAGETGVGQREDVARGLAEKMAEPGWARDRFQKLSPQGRSALRLVLRSGGSARADDLDALAARHAGATAVGGATELYDAGFCWASEERSYKGTHLRYRIVQPLAMRCHSLLDEFDDKPTVPPPPDAGAIRYAEWRPVYEEAVLLAAIEAARPRTKGFGKLHKTDETALAKSLCGLFGGSSDVAIRRIERIAVEGPLRLDAGRLRLDEESLSKTPPSFARVAAGWARVHRYNRSVLALLARLCDSEGWCTEAELVEAAAPFLLAGHPTGNAGHELDTVLGHVLRFPGVIEKKVDGVIYAWAVGLLRGSARGGFPDGSAATGMAFVQPNLQVTVQVDCDPVPVARLGRFCRLVTAGEASVFAVDETLVRRAAAEGLDGARILGRLEAFARQGVPVTVARALAEWGRSGTTVDVVLDALVVVGDLTIATFRKVVPEATVRELRPGVLVVEDVTADTVVRALRDEGIGARLLVPAKFADRERTPEPSQTDPGGYLAEVFQEARKSLRESRDSDAGRAD